MIVNVKLPARFAAKLEKEQWLDGIVKSTLSNFGQILADNKLYFFEEFTDHGIAHIENVIAASDNLITDTTFNGIMSPTDIAHYILAVVAHDIAMHIGLDGFNCLLEGQFDDVRIKEFDKHTWEELWEEYLSEARRFSGKQLNGIFGDEKTVIRIPPLSDKGQINGNDRKLIGEFIRRHHTRLAHEIVIKGFPGNPDILPFAPSLEVKNNNLIGLIARSHGMDLRRCIDYVELKYGKNNKRHPFGVHVTYLMVLLRIADYIQIDSDRTSKTLIRLKTFSSPVSASEHDTHLAIDNIDSKYQDDPERIFVSAAPADSKMYLKIRKLIKDIQYEFDMSWAILGEVYGRVTEKPAIKYRRINSNIEDDSFVLQQDYVTDTFSFRSNDEIIKLLIGPLYGEDPKYGVRELLQNSIDACLEREKICAHLKDGQYAPLIRVEVFREEKAHKFIITDNGIGMDIDIIKNYFLSAGASYRRSSEWKKEFINDDGISIVRRSGRFGVGVLAAFLIGHDIYVETKRVNAETGYRFNANLNTQQINIFKDKNLNVGTKIVITIPESLLEEGPLPEDAYYSTAGWFNWFTLSHPKVEYLRDGYAIEPYSNLDPDLNNELPIQWSAVDSPGFDKILWTYSNEYTANEYTCNGIVIEEGYRWARKHPLDLALIDNQPHISIFDSNAILPLALDRNSFSGPFTFRNDLLEDIYKDFIAYMLSIQGMPTVIANNIQNKNGCLKYKGIDSEYSRGCLSYGNNKYDPDHYQGVLRSLLNETLICREGFILNYNFFIQKLNLIKALLIQQEAWGLDILTLDLKDHFLSIEYGKLLSYDDYKHAIFGSRLTSDIDSSIQSRVYLKKGAHKRLFESAKVLGQRQRNLCAFELEKSDWVSINVGQFKGESIITDDFLDAYEDAISLIREYEIRCEHPGDETLNKLLERYLGDDVIIPYSIDERRKKYPLAFKELARHMKKYLQPANADHSIDLIDEKTVA